jgi:hypothetical protein
MSKADAKSRGRPMKAFENFNQNIKSPHISQPPLDSAQPNAFVAWPEQAV